MAIDSLILNVVLPLLIGVISSLIADDLKNRSRWRGRLDAVAVSTAIAGLIMAATLFGDPQSGSGIFQAYLAQLSGPIFFALFAILSALSLPKPKLTMPSLSIWTCWAIFSFAFFFFEGAWSHYYGVNIERELSIPSHHEVSFLESGKLLVVRADEGCVAVTTLSQDFSSIETTVIGQANQLKNHHSLDGQFSKVPLSGLGDWTVAGEREILKKCRKEGSPIPFAVDQEHGQFFWANDSHIFRVSGARGEYQRASELVIGNVSPEKPVEQLSYAKPHWLYVLHRGDSYIGLLDVRQQPKLQTTRPTVRLKGNNRSWRAASNGATTVVASAAGTRGVRISAEDSGYFDAGLLALPGEDIRDVDVSSTGEAAFALVKGGILTLPQKESRSYASLCSPPRELFLNSISYWDDRILMAHSSGVSVCLAGTITKLTGWNGAIKSIAINDAQSKTALLTDEKLLVGTLINHKFLKTTPRIILLSLLILLYGQKKHSAST